MKIRLYQESDTPQIMQLFYQTVHTINARDYTPEQLAAWAPETASEANWRDKLSESICYVVESSVPSRASGQAPQDRLADKEDTIQIIGFGDLTPRGHLGHLFVHKDFQRSGVASLIMQTLIQEALNYDLYKITAEVSITARPFFEKFGFEVVTKKKKVLRGMGFVAFQMRKLL